MIILCLPTYILYSETEAEHQNLTWLVTDHL